MHYSVHQNGREEASTFWGTYGVACGVLGVLLLSPWQPVFLVETVVMGLILFILNYGAR